MRYNDSITENFSQVINDIKQIIDTGKNAAYAAVDATMIATYWNIGRRIVEEEQHGQERAQYGKELIKTLAKELTHEYGNVLPTSASSTSRCLTWQFCKHVCKI